MTTEHSNWNGYDVYGDIRELDTIVKSTGFINLDKDDIIGVLSAEGENCVTTGTDNSIEKAFTKAVNGLPYTRNKMHEYASGCLKSYGINSDCYHFHCNGLTIKSIQKT